MRNRQVRWTSSQSSKKEYQNKDQKEKEFMRERAKMRNYREFGTKASEQYTEPRRLGYRFYDETQQSDWRRNKRFERLADFREDVQRGYRGQKRRWSDISTPELLSERNRLKQRIRHLRGRLRRLDCQLGNRFAQKHQMGHKVRHAG